MYAREKIEQINFNLVPAFIVVHNLLPGLSLTLWAISLYGRICSPTSSGDCILIAGSSWQRHDS